MKFRFSFLRVTALLLCVLTLCVGLCSCSGGNTVSARKVVGEVDGVEIYYDEVYMLANRYRATAQKAAQKNGTTVAEELDRLVRENVTLHVAMIRQGEALGLSYNQKDWEDRIDDELTALITDGFGGDKSAYRESMQENALTERYVRYTLGVDLFYEQLLTEYPKQGLVVSSEAEILSYIDENFVHVYHLAAFFDESNQQEKLAKMEEARQKLLEGESMYSLIKKGYTEDFLDPSASGYYIVRGTMDQPYEDAAFSLQIGQVSEIIESKGYNNKNEYSSCYYVMQRFEIDDAYVETHFNEMQTEYYNSVIYADLEKVRAELTFVPNDFYRDLSLLELVPARDGLPTGALIALSVGAVVVVGGGVTVAMILICKKPKKKQAALEKVSE